MKRIFILLVLLIVVAKLNAQTWAPNGATWHYTFNQMFSYGYVKIVHTSDTTVLSKNCKILQKTQYGYSYPGVYDTINLGKEFTYFDSTSNIVYRYFDNKFDTLYNFNALTGNKWTVHGMHGSPDSGIVVVDSIGQIIINSDTLKSLFVSTITGSCIGWSSAEIVERIGCINDYMFPNYIACVMDAGEGGPLRCYSDDNFPIYMTGETTYCDFITSIDSYINKIELVDIYPNPTSSSIIIRNKNTLPTDFNVVLMSSLSQKVFEYDIYLTKDFIIDISDLKTGLYLLQITNDKGYNMTKKIIKN